ncbi:hypothetical protein B296_00011546 [Ensete ventricosum]|uniref:Uncharacterized protein n=1 Tax=Ensete ventricosum TaxID=4639 RepID=A0A426ZVQ8_ENSVE|nr:hypothetical protein B296_00011546 [Ensete ventricosum]
MIDPIKESEEEDLEPEEENMKEDPQPADCTTHSLAGYTNPQMIKVEGSLKQQLIVVLTNNLMNGKGEQVTLRKKRGSEVMTISTQCLEKLVEISGASTEPSRLHDLHILILQEESLAHIPPYYCPHLQKAKIERIIQEKLETQIIQP